MSAHTPEPWKAFGDGDDSYIDGVMNYHSGEGGAYLIDGSDVRRIVACVNACAGATDEQLEGAAGKLFTGSAIALWSSYCDVKQQRDALQQRCEELLTDNAKMKQLLLHFLYHHQGASSVIGQPIRILFGMNDHEHMTDDQIAIAKQVQPCNPPPTGAGEL